MLLLCCVGIIRGKVERVCLKSEQGINILFTEVERRVLSIGSERVWYQAYLRVILCMYALLH